MSDTFEYAPGWSIEGHLAARDAEYAGADILVQDARDTEFCAVLGYDISDPEETAWLR